MISDEERQQRLHAEDVAWAMHLSEIPIGTMDPSIRYRLECDYRQNWRRQRITERCGIRSLWACGQATRIILRDVARGVDVLFYLGDIRHMEQSRPDRVLLHGIGTQRILAQGDIDDWYELMGEVL